MCVCVQKVGRELVNCPSNLSLYLLFIIEKEKEKMAGPMPTATVTNFVKACCNEVNLKLTISFWNPNNCSGKCNILEVSFRFACRTMPLDLVGMSQIQLFPGSTIWKFFNTI